MKTLLAILFFAGAAQAGVPYWQPPMASTSTAYGTGYLAGLFKVYPATTTAAAAPAIMLDGVNRQITARNGAAVSTMSSTGFYGNGSGLTNAANAAYAAALSTAVYTTGAQSIAGAKTFTDAMTVASVTVTGANGGYGLLVSSNVSLAGAIYSANGKVGIGTASPTRMLELKGESARFAITDSNPYDSVSMGDTSGSGGFINIHDANGGIMSRISGYGVSYITAGNFGVGATAPYTALEIAKTDPILRLTDTDGTADKKTFEIRGVGAAGYEALSFRKVNDANSVYTSLLTLLEGGNVGIGTTVPATAFEVKNGAASFSADGVAHGMTALYATNAYGRASILDGTYGGLLLDGASDNAAGSGMKLRGIIGVADPTDTTAAISFQVGKANGTTFQALGAAETSFAIYNYTTGLMTVLGNGNTGFGTVSPQTTLHVSGGVQISSSAAIAPAMAVGVREGLHFTHTVSDGNSRISASRGSVNGKLQFVADTYDFYTGAGVLNASILANGNVGVAGITAPTHSLEATTAKFTGIDASSVTATAFIGSGAGLTDVSNLVSSGTVSVATGTISIAGLDGNADGEYRLVFFSSTTDSGASFSLYFNGDVTATNYYRAIGGAAANSSVFMFTSGMGSPNQIHARIDISRGADGHVFYSSQGLKTNSSDIVSLDAKGHHVSAQTNITSISIVGPNNVMLVGTTWELYRSR